MYVLIVIALSGYGPRPHMWTQEFTSFQNCKVAQQVILEGWAKSGDSSHLGRVVCAKK